MAYDPMLGIEQPQCWACGAQCDPADWDEDLEMACCGRDECVWEVEAWLGPPGRP